MLRLHEVVKSYREPSGMLHVLDGLSLGIAPGEIVLLQGPSGSGKTTLLQITGCLLRADSGSVELAGQDLNTADEAARTAARQAHLGFCFQQFHLLDALTVWHNVALGLRLKRQAITAQRVDEVLELVGLTKKMQKLPRDLSVGEKQRVALARAVHELRRVRAAADGHILLLHRPAGDVVSLQFATPILRMAVTTRLCVRLEINEQGVQRVSEGMQGQFTFYGAAKPNGRLRIVTLLPAFAPRRLFEPDSTARLDTRTLNALCEIVCEAAPVYAGQRVMAELEVKE
ncbi:MAG: ATP-binding cassette domain-containing protein [Prosthecobacter sp.]|uniref:ATP-binding cassette domain-containing protein n=1 Tax=Prosthecobacter sp. TaxID=1965333 RepID=UPI0039014F55